MILAGDIGGTHARLALFDVSGGQYVPTSLTLFASKDYPSLDAIAAKFVEAATTYADHPAALQLRAMNIIYETTKERGATILLPTAMLDALNPKNRS